MPLAHAIAFPPGPVLQSQVVGGPVDGSVGSRVTAEAKVKRQYACGYTVENGGSFSDGNNEWIVDADRVTGFVFFGNVTQLAATGDGKFRIRDDDNSVNWGNEQTIPEGSTVSFQGTTFSKHASSSGVIEMGPEVQSGQSGIQIRLYDGAFAEEVLA